MAVNKKQVGIAAAVAAALSLATPFVASWEGKRNVAYRDVAGIPTICYGSIRGVQMGDRKTDAECTALLSTEIREHMEPVLRCTPILADGRHPYQLAAATSLAFNIGGDAYCRSTVARRFNAGNIRAGCDAFLMWNRAGGRVVQGLTNRRQAERRQCLTGIAA